MEILDLLWDLELHQQSLKKHLTQSIKLENDQSFIEVEKNLHNKKERLIESKEDQRNAKDKLQELELKINEYRIRVTELENTLYNSNSQDFKYLETLENEKNKIVDLIDKQEFEIIESLLELEEIDRELIELEKLLNETLIFYNKRKNKFENLKRKLKDKVNEEKLKIANIEEDIDQNILNKFYQIRKNKTTAMANVKNNVCTGCNLQISFIQLDKLNMDNEIIFCDNCGRILYNKK